MDYTLSSAPTLGVNSRLNDLVWNQKTPLEAARLGSGQEDAAESNLVAGLRDDTSGSPSTRPAMATGHPAADVQKNEPSAVLNPIDGMPLYPDDHNFRNQVESLYTGKGYLLDMNV